MYMCLYIHANTQQHQIDICGIVHMLLATATTTMGPMDVGLKPLSP